MAKWAIVAKNMAADRYEVMTSENLIAPDDPAYGPDVHIAPLVGDGEYLSFGFHEFKRDCICHPKMEFRGGRNLVLHNDRVN